MTREIKFRCWDKTHNEMFFIEDIFRIKNSKFIENCRNGLCEVMQYTGLKDKSGKEIWESDYLEIPEVNDNSKTWCVFWGSGKYILQNISTGDILDCNETNTNTKEVTGNRYENPREHTAMASIF